MKKTVIILCLTCFSIGFSQDKNTTTYPQYEWKGNALLLLGGALDISYEKYISDDSGYGISAFIAYDKDLDRKFSLTPYYRIYFGQKKAAGFFIEGFGMINNYRTTAYTFESMNFIALRQATVTDLALGFGLGGKWVTKKGILFEINTGVGRNLLYKEDNVNRMEFVGRGGIGIGYRF